MSDLKPVSWKVINPFDVNCPLTLTVCDDTLVHVPLKLATCEHDNPPVPTTKYEGTDT